MNAGATILRQRGHWVFRRDGDSFVDPLIYKRYHDHQDKEQTDESPCGVWSSGGHVYAV